MQNFNTITSEIEKIGKKIPADLNSIKEKKKMVRQSST